LTGNATEEELKEIKADFILDSVSDLE